MEQLFLKSVDGYELDLHIFEAKEAKAVVQLAHGMEEHQERYEDFAKFLVKNGFTVVSADMRGHGKNAKNLGYFSDKDGDKLLVKDHLKIRDFIAKRFPNLPIYLFAHSMGTIIARVVLQKNSSKYDKVVLSGYPAYQSGAGFGVFLTDVVKLFRGAKYKSKIIQKIGIGVFNNEIKNPRTDIDWVCANEKTVDEYLRDPLCGTGFTISAFGDLFRLVVQMNKSEECKKVKKDLPILLLAGKDDPCTKGEKGRSQSRKTLEEEGFENIEQITYPNMRHEILNEKDNQKVYDDILKFYES